MRAYKITHLIVVRTCVIRGCIGRAGDLES